MRRHFYFPIATKCTRTPSAFKLDFFQKHHPCEETSHSSIRFFTGNHSSASFLPPAPRYFNHANICQQRQSSCFQSQGYSRTEGAPRKTSSTSNTEEWPKKLPIFDPTIFELNFVPNGTLWSDVNYNKFSSWGANSFLRFGRWKKRKLTCQPNFQNSQFFIESQLPQNWK